MDTESTAVSFVNGTAEPGNPVIPRKSDQSKSH